MVKIYDAKILLVRAENQEQSKCPIKENWLKKLEWVAISFSKDTFTFI